MGLSGVPSVALGIVQKLSTSCKAMLASANHSTRPPQTPLTVRKRRGVFRFVGYFDSKLYGDVHISTYPKTETAGMFSWFPIYFPVTVPIHVPAGRKVKVHFWRCVSSSKVWYEWAVTSPTTTHCHNVNGRSYWVGL